MGDPVLACNNHAYSRRDFEKGSKFRTLRSTQTSRSRYSPMPPNTCRLNNESREQHSLRCDGRHSKPHVAAICVCLQRTLEAFCVTYVYTCDHLDGAASGSTVPHKERERDAVEHKEICCHLCVSYGMLQFHVYSRIVF